MAFVTRGRDSSIPKYHPRNPILEYEDDEDEEDDDEEDELEGDEILKWRGVSDTLGLLSW